LDMNYKITGYRGSRHFISIALTLIKVAVAIALIEYVEYGLYIVLGYLLYVIEDLSGLAFINRNEANLELNNLHQRIDTIEGKIVGQRRG